MILNLPLLSGHPCSFFTGSAMVKLEHIIDEIILWIDTNIHKPIRIDDVAARAGYSKWHLQRVFMQTMNITMACYIRDKKLSLAAHDLQHTHESIISISMKYGFESQPAFTRSFSQKYHVPPAQYRRLSNISERPQNKH